MKHDNGMDWIYTLNERVSLYIGLEEDVVLMQWVYVLMMLIAWPFLFRWLVRMVCYEYGYADNVDIAFGVIIGGVLTFFWPLWLFGAFLYWLWNYLGLSAILPKVLPKGIDYKP